jgi:predicted transcriptional regulator
VHTPLEIRILAILQAAGDQWLRSSDIAKHLGGRQQLRPHDVRIVKRLLAKGLIEKRIYQIRAGREIYRYRFNPESTQDAPSAEA